MSMNIDNNKKRGQPSKAIRFPNERMMVAKKILNILGITKDNNIFKLNDKTTRLQQSIFDLEPEVRKYFNAGGWNIYKKGIEVEKGFISVTKHVMKEVGVKVIHSQTYEKGIVYSLYQFDVSEDIMNIDKILDNDYNYINI
jgi:hypothetical protein